LFWFVGLLCFGFGLFRVYFTAVVAVAVAVADDRCKERLVGDWSPLSP
jgi:hypothetical protein